MNASMLFLRQFFLFLGLLVLCAMGVPGAAVAADDVEALYEAAGEGKSSRVVELLKAGTDVNGRTSRGSYALNAAAGENVTSVIQILLAHGANPNVRNSEGDTPLICATKYAGGRVATVEMLVKAGADLGVRDNKGKTALDYAQAKGQQQAVAILQGLGN